MPKKIPSVLDLTADIKRNFKVYIDDKEIQVKKRLVIESAKFGHFNYGLSPLGFDEIVFENPNIGGAVIVPYVILEEELFIGFVEQARPNLMNKNGDFNVLNLPRGLSSGGETHKEAAKREGWEEMAVPDNKVHFKKLSPPLNQDSTFFATIPRGKHGVEFYSAEFDKGMLVKHKKNIYKIKNVDFAESVDELEYTSKVLFYHWIKVFDTYDMYSWLGVLLLRESFRG